MTLPCVEVETRLNPTHAVIWLHGLGADGHDFEPMVPQLVDQGWPALRFVFPHAPMRAVTVNGGMRMRAWYDIRGVDLAARQDEVGIRESIESVDELIERETKRGILPEHILLAGFSQGGAVVLASGLRYPQRLAGIIALSTYLPLHESLAIERNAVNAATPIFMAHGSLDPIVPQQLGMMSREVLSSLGYPVAWYSYPMAHQLCLPEISDLRSWISERLAG